jgi:branched-chain amino acid transport system substrate-binding protein
LHPLGQVKDFLPYANKIKASSAQAVLTGNWGNDLTLLVRALREVGSEAKLYTFYGNALGAPAAIGEAGIGRVLAVAEWHPNAGGAASEAFYAAFKKRFANPADDYVHVRMQVLVEMLAGAIEQAGSTDAVQVAQALEGARFDASKLGGLHEATMRAADHQLQQPLIVSVMDRAGSPGVPHDVEGSGFGFRTLRRLPSAAVTQGHQCNMPSTD